MITTKSFTSNIKSNLSYWFANNRLSITTFILLIGLIAFEMFNYSTTDYALKDLLGDLKFAGFYWSTILAVAFCLIDFAGIARLFMPGNKLSDIKEDWFLFGAWFLAATMNAILTWWGVSMSIVNHSIMSSKIIDSETIHLVVPIFVSIMVWVTRILLIGSLTLSDQRTTTKSQTRVARPSTHTSVSPRYNSSGSTLTSRGASLQSKVPVQSNLKQPRFSNRPDPEYVSDPTSSIQQPAFQGRSQNNTSVRRF
jgi:hypothetical protein